MNLCFSRRGFLKSATAVAASVPAWFIDMECSQAAPEQPKSPTDKPNIGLIGCGGQGRGDAKGASNFGNVVAVCDVDAGRAEQTAASFKGAKAYADFRKLLEHPDLHVIVNGTPDHWHTLVNLAALKAGKDIYSEKPLTLTIDEGKRLVAAVHAGKQILQTGSQQRSDAKFRLACELVRNGRLGKLSHVTVVLPAGLRGGPFKTAPVPAKLNWDFWQGQVHAVDYVPERCHFSFRYWYDYSGGTMTDWGAHHNDIALWGLGAERSGPVAVEGKALVEPIPGGFTAASEYDVTYTYAGGLEHRCLSTTVNKWDGSVLRQPKAGELPHGVKFEGADGWLFVTRGKIEASRPEILNVPLEGKRVTLPVSNNHMANFFDCVKTRMPPICDAEIGHRSASLCHLGVIAIRLGRKLRWDPAKEMFIGDKEANGFVAREMRKPWDYAMV